MKPRILLFAAMLLTPLCSVAQQRLDLSGAWEFECDRQDVGVAQQWFNRPLTDRITLPGSMPERLKGDDVSVHTVWTGSLYDSSYFFNPAMEKYRQDGAVKLPFFLTPDKHYVGVAWYRKEVTLPREWEGQRVVLFLERPHIETTVWVNQVQVGMQNSLCVPHVYDVTQALQEASRSARTCILTIRVDNRIKEINVGPDSHSITDQTQGNWNGIVGKMELQAGSPVYFDDIQIYPDIEKKTARVRMVVNAPADWAQQALHITLRADGFNAPVAHAVPPVTASFRLTGLATKLEMTLPMGPDVQLWDEFSPALYRLTATLEIPGQAGGVSDSTSPSTWKDERQVSFGMRSFTIQGKWFYVNGRQVMLRGTVENCDFPLTGYAPMDVAAWEKVFRTCRSYGLNHMRFHSCCPPEAAFIAADLTGFYLQPEGPSWPNHGPRLGQGQPIDRYLMDETIALTKAYGNYASFCMLACGNEPAGRWVDWVTDFVHYWQAADTRRVYTGASVGNSWQWQPANQYHVKAGARGLTWAQQQPESQSDFRARIDTVRQPYVSHETGQWCAFPNFNEIDKYTGVNKAKNFEIFRDILTENGMGAQAQDFLEASSRLQFLCYKHEIEKTLRTPDFAGFQLLALNDYSGQGTALVGVLDVFFEEKGIVTASEFRRFCSPTVPLARMEKFTFSQSDTLRVDVEVAHFGAAPLQDVRTRCVVRDAQGKVVYETTFAPQDVRIGNNQVLGRLDVPLAGWVAPARYNVEVQLEGTQAINDWDFWVYPRQVTATPDDVYIATQWDDHAQDLLNKGGKVLLCAGEKLTYGQGIVQHFTPVFWNTSWFKMRPPHTLGIVVQDTHPAFAQFPTAGYSTLQWWELVNGAPVMLLTDFPVGFTPLVQSIDTWFLSRRLGMLLEARVGNGKLMVTTMDVQSRLEERVVARQMRASLLAYMNSPSFNPTWDVPQETIINLFEKETPPVDNFTKGSPDDLRPQGAAQPATVPGKAAKSTAFAPARAPRIHKTYVFDTKACPVVLSDSCLRVTAADVYTTEKGYGFDILPPPDAKNPQPFYFSVKVPDGNYRVTVTLGATSGPGQTSVLAESRRLYVEQVHTAKKETVTFSFVVNKRDSMIREGQAVRLKPREIGKLNWDEKLTLAFAGPRPCVALIAIESDYQVPTLFLCGNSTVTDQDIDPWASWGQMIPRFFNDQVCVANYAESGEAANTFLSAGRLDKILTQLKPGDYVFMEFGHNDQKQTGPGKGAYYSFTSSLKVFVDKAHEAGAIPVLVTPTQRRSFDDAGKIVDTHLDFPEAMRWMAQKEGLPLIDLHAQTRVLYETLGVEGSKKAFVHYPANAYPGQTAALADNTHFNPYGAYQIAHIFMEGMKAVLLPVAPWLRPDVTSYTPTAPDPADAFIWYELPPLETAKP